MPLMNAHLGPRILSTQSALVWQAKKLIGLILNNPLSASAAASAAAAERAGSGVELATQPAASIVPALTAASQVDWS